MNDHEPIDSYESPGLLTGWHLPFTLLAAGLALFLYAQVSNIALNASSMDWQGANLDRQLASHAESEQNLTALAQQRQALVQQSEQIQSRYTGLIADLLELSKVDPDTRSIVEKYGIQRRENSSSQQPAAYNPPP